MRYRILVGEYLGNGPAGCKCSACETSGGKNHRYKAAVLVRNSLCNPDTLQPITVDNPYTGDIIDTNSDLDKFNCGPYSRKFERVAETTAKGLADIARASGISEELLELLNADDAGGS